MQFLQVPKIPTGGNKRRMPDLPSAEMLKKMRLEPESAPNATAPDSRSHSAVPPKRVTTVHDEDEDDNAESERVAFAPGNDADYFAEEDEEGRFFGGGLTAEQKEILNIFDNAGADQVPDDVRGRACSLLFTQRQSLVVNSLKHSLLLASESYCYGWRELPTRTRCSDRNFRTIQQSESCGKFACSCFHYSSAQIHRLGSGP
jgi:hypothetical protein